MLCLTGEVTAPSQPTPVSSLVPQPWLSLQRLLALFVGGKKKGFVLKLFA